MCRLLLKSAEEGSVTDQPPHDDSYAVQLSVDGHEYCAEVRCTGDGEWTLLSIEVEGLPAKSLNWKASSCVDALAAAEALAKQIIAATTAQEAE